MAEVKKMKCYERLIFKQFVQVLGLCGSQFQNYICRNVSRTFVELCMETPCWCTDLAHQCGRGKSTMEYTFCIKAPSFHSRISIRAHKISSNTWNGYTAQLTAENQEEILFFNESAFLFWCHAL